jgi:DNA-directed RNA polymerase subunit RPC12/RpoP
MGRAKIALKCVECGREAGEIAPGWQAYLVSDPDIEDDEEIVVYCPDCARREFGPFTGSET